MRIGSFSLFSSVRKYPARFFIIGGLAALTLVALDPIRATAIIPLVINETCSLSTACATIVNTAKGPALQANSATGVSVIGRSTSSYGVTGSTKASGSQAGVAGFDDSTSGVKTDAGVYGTSSNGLGVEGVSQQGVGVQGTSASNGVVGSTTSKTGASGVMGIDNGPSGNGSGVEGTSNAGHGVTGYSTSGDGIFTQSGNNGIVAFGKQTAIVAHHNGASGTAIVSAIDTNGDVFVGTDGTKDQDVVSIDNHGNEILAGTLTQSGQPMVRTTTSNGSTVAAYSARTSSPTLEDFGEARLSNGQGYVALDQTFAAAIDARAKYMVFLSPQGDNRGLYVSAITGHGFAVRESNGGRSTLTFDYRIVAKPYDSNATRLAPTTAFSGLVHGRFLPLPTRVR